MCMCSLRLAEDYARARQAGYLEMGKRDRGAQRSLWRDILRLAQGLGRKLGEEGMRTEMLREEEILEPIRVR